MRIAMPKYILMTKVYAAANELPQTTARLAHGIVVSMQASHVSIKEHGNLVFTMKKLEVAGTDLIVDYPQEKQGQEGRGWGILAMLMALYHGFQRGCTTVKLGSQIEQTTKSVSFWGKFGIARMDGTPLVSCLKQGIQWVVTHCPQEDRKITGFVLRDPAGGTGPTATTTRARSNSLGSRNT
jgi:hypothetical protein